MYVSEGWRLVNKGIMILRKLDLYWLLYFLMLWWFIGKHTYVKTMDHGG